MAELLSLVLYEWNSSLFGFSAVLLATLTGNILGAIAASSLANQSLVVELLTVAVVAVSVGIPLLVLINGVALRLHPRKQLPDL